MVGRRERTRIGIDIDGTVCESVPSVLALTNARAGTNYTKENITDWNWSDGNGIEIGNEIYNAFGDPDFVRSLPPIEGAVKGVRSLSRKFDLVFVTTRHISRKLPTEAWIREHFGKIAVQHIVGEGNKNGTDLDILVDDNPTNVLNFFITHRNAIIFDQPWNRGVREHPNANGCIVRCKSWPCVVRKISELTGVAIPDSGKKP